MRYSHSAQHDAQVAAWYSHIISRKGGTFASERVNFMPSTNTSRSFRARQTARPCDLNKLTNVVTEVIRLIGWVVFGIAR